MLHICIKHPVRVEEGEERERGESERAEWTVHGWGRKYGWREGLRKAKGSATVQG